MKELGGKTNKEILFYDEGSKWRALVKRCADLTQQDEAARAAIADEAQENFWRDHVVPDHVVPDDDTVSKAMQADIDKGGLGH